MATFWGIHNDALGRELVDEGFVSVGWDAIGDLRRLGNDRTAIKAAVASNDPDAKPGAIPVVAGVLARFAFEMQQGDIVIAPYKPDSTINFGRVSGPYEFHPEVEQHMHRRRVTWLRTGVPRAQFSQAALYEIGAFITLFKVARHRDEFERFLATGGSAVPEHVDTATDDELVRHAAEAPNADRIEQHTRDFVTKTLLSGISHREFEEFTADLLRTLGYQTRVTPYSTDGGVDVIAHRDPLGLEPPIIKVQCKHTAAGQGRPEVQQLIGTLSSTELGLFVSLGAYSKDARDLERERHNLRLFDGAEVTRLTIDHYAELPSRWRRLMPLRPVLVVDLDPQAG